MHIAFDQLDKLRTYRLLTHAVLPRPIAWVLTENENGTMNVAPFSYFTIISSDPAILMFSMGHKRDGSQKDTWRNLEQHKRCVVHIAHADQLSQLNETARALPYGESEAGDVNLTLVKDNAFQLPRIDGCTVAFEAQLYDLHTLGNGPQAVAYVQVTQAFVDDAVMLDEHFTLDAGRLRPVARLGGDLYAELGPISELKRP